MTEKTKKKGKAPRVAMPEQQPEVRRRNFEEVPLGFAPEKMHTGQGNGSVAWQV